ncbi:MAG TPA: SPOR domain-containing protein [Methylophaga sp.]|nr:SPOR domain-containing protein [Methylophaga sp.]
MINRMPLSIFGLSIILLTGCNTTTQKTIENKPQITTSNEVSITAQEVKMLRESSQQWQQSKAGIERLLVIEQDLNLLIKQLTAVAKEQKKERSYNAQKNQNENPAYTTTNNKKPKFNETVPTDKSAFETHNPSSEELPLYALQVASVSDRSRLIKSYNELKVGNEEMFNGEVAANFETVKINDVTYYRLKLGAFANQNNAKSACNKLKQKSISCIVSHYTQQPIK